jgi:lipopolysaccharide transport system permease protein
MNGLREIWDKKQIIWEFAKNDLKIRYRNSVLGFLWTLLEPLLFLLVLYVVFTNIFENNIENFPLYLLSGIIIWNMLVKGTQISLTGISSRSALFTHIKIPVAIPAISAGITALLMFTLELVILGTFMVAFQFIPPTTILIFPLIILLEFVLIIGVALPLSLVNIRIKDIQFMWNIILHAGFFLHPIFYQPEILPENVLEAIKFSPMFHILEFSRNVMLYNKLPQMEETLMAIGMTFVIFVIGYLVFRKLSGRILEEI